MRSVTVDAPKPRSSVTDRCVASREAAVATFLAGIGVTDVEVLDAIRRSVQDICVEPGSFETALEHLNRAFEVQRDAPTVAMDRDPSTPDEIGGRVGSRPKDDPRLQETLLYDAGVASRSDATPSRFGDYEILNEIAKGGMGVVYKARQTKLDRIVALKMIKSAELADDKQVRRFYTEAESAAKLSHPGIVPVFDIGEVGGRHYFSMAFVDGESLFDRVKREGPLLPREAARLMRDAAEAVAHAHDAGIVHRDIKPQNILLDRLGKVQVTDFGLAKLQQPRAELTADGQILGTPAYMPPEQAAGRADDVGVPADVYSLGSTLYYLLTGRPPFQAATVHETLRQVIDNEPLAPRKLDPSIPKDIEIICLKALRKERVRRYESARQLADDLDHWLHDRPITARPVSRVEKVWKWAKRHPEVSGSLVVLLVVSIAVQQYAAGVDRKTKRERAATAVNSLMTANGTAVPFALRECDALPREMVLAELRAQLSATTGQERLSLNYGLAHYGEVELQELTDPNLIRKVPAAEVMNLVAALSHDRERAIAMLDDSARAATLEQDYWVAKAHLATVSLHLESPELAIEMLQAFPAAELSDLLPTLRRRLEHLATVPEAERDSFPSRSTRAYAHFYLDEPEKALADLDVLAREERPGGWIIFMRAIALARTGSAGEAREAIAGLRSAAPDDRFATFGEILVHAWLGDVDRAEQMMETLIQDQPENAGARYDAARVAAQLAKIDQESAPAEARRLRGRAIELLREMHAASELAPMGPGIDPLFIPLHQETEFRALIAELPPPAVSWDPTQRTRFIAEFPNWCGDLGSLVHVVRGIDDPDFRSGIALAIGGVTDPDRDAQESWGELLAEWYAHAPDGGTHSAARWALTRWDASLPEIAADETLPDSRDWSRTPSGLTLMQIPVGVILGFPVRSVERAFWLCDSEVSLPLFLQFLEDHEYDGPKPTNLVIEGRNEVAGVSWYDTLMFCNWLSLREGLTPCYQIEEAGGRNEAGGPLYDVSLNEEANGYRLPTELQWEHACRARTTTRYTFGDSVDDLKDYGIYFFSSETPASDAQRCNGWGLFQMHGNLAEWCWDNQEAAPGEQTVAAGSLRIVRGGGFSYGAQSCTSESRMTEHPFAGRPFTGFRVARVLVPEDHLRGRRSSP